MEILSNVGLGLATALTPVNLFYCFVGVFLGTLVGVLPGVGVLSTITLLFPFTFYLEPATAIIMLAGVWYGTGYGGRTSAILLNIPGGPSQAVTCLDGYPMARQGRAGVALFMTTMASFAGGCIGILALMFFTPILADAALSFGPAEYFTIMLLGLVAASCVSVGSPIKAFAMVLVGIAFGTVGADLRMGTPRFDFGFIKLFEGISLVALAMGVFGIAEIIDGVPRMKSGEAIKQDVSMKAMKPTRDDVRRSWLPTLRGSLIGCFFGALPGTGPAVASFTSYATELRVNKEPERFGKGAIEGVMAPEAADNAAEQTSFIPTLGLGIPGSATMALMLGALTLHGINPGPALMSDHPELFWGLVMSFWVGNVLLLILNIPLIGLWVRLLTIPYSILFPAILVFICVGTYSVGLSSFDIWLVLTFGAFGYLLRLLDMPATPLLLGFVLGPMIENNFRLAMLLARGDFMTFLQRPISAAVLVLTVLLVGWVSWSGLRQRRKKMVNNATA